jgi:outer membrane biosynthesis protein TonB
MKVSPLALILITACATTQTMDSREPAARARVQLDLSAAPEIEAAFPQAVNPRLPSVDRIAHQIRARLGDEAVAAIELCVAPDGHVTKVALLEPTAYASFDTALDRDIEGWQFVAMPGTSATAQLQTCERATVKYLAPR